MITGQVPFKGDYEKAVIYSIINEEPLQLTAMRSGISIELEAIVNKCLEKNPSNRYQHVDDLIVDLRRFKRDSDSKITTSRTDMMPKESTERKKPFLISAILLSVAIIIVVGYFLINQLILEDKSESESTGADHWENLIAVLLFDDLSPEKDQEFFCDGMTEQIITNLSKINRLKVIGRTSIMTYKKKDKQLLEIGKELNVTHILEGSIRKYGNSIRVTAQLINTEDGSHLWADDFDRELEHVFEVQDDVSEKIATNLFATLSPQENKKIKTIRPSNTLAYEYYMKGMYFHYEIFFKTRNLEDFKISEKMFKRAIELDQNYADSYANLADLYNSYYNIVAKTDAEKDKYMYLQESYLDTAILLNSNSSEVYRVKGMVHSAKHEFDDAIESEQKALKINRNNSEAYWGLGRIYTKLGLYDLALKYLDIYIKLEPIKAIGYAQRGALFNSLGYFEKAINDFEKGIKLDPTKNTLYSFYHQALMMTKNYEKAEDIASMFQELKPNHKLINLYKAILHAARGEKEEALDLYDGRLNYVIYAYLDMKVEFFDALMELEWVMKPKFHSYYFYLQNGTFFDSFRSDPRFQEILAKHKELYDENLRKYGDIDI
jgi:TolB-like protein/Flp pilus assembly protein TadD